MAKSGKQQNGRDSVALLKAAIADGLAWRTANPSKYTSDGRLKSKVLQAREAEAAKVLMQQKPE